MKTRNPVLVCCLLMVSSIVSAQEKNDTTPAVFQFSGTLILTTNGISPIPAFSLEKPAILGFLSLRKKGLVMIQKWLFHPREYPGFLITVFAID